MLLLDGHKSHVSIDFLWEYKQNNVHAVFLPAHSSHVLQLLDLSCFSSLKTWYQQQITVLASLDDATPVKKRFFVKYYNLTCQQDLTEHVIRSGWKAAGLVPWNPNIALDSSQIIQPRPTTPPQPKRPRPEDFTFTTPRKPQQFQRTIQCLEQGQKLSRDCRVALQKAGKVVEELIMENVKKETVLRGLESRLEGLQSKQAKKKITVDPNNQFARVEEIKQALDQAKSAQAQQAEKEAEQEAQRAVEALSQYRLEDCMHSWQL